MRRTLERLKLLIELWSRREEPASHDLRQAVRIAERLDGDGSAPVAMKALAYRIVTELHTMAGWEVDESAALSACRSAATSVAQTSQLLLQEVETQLRGAPGPALILGVLGAGRRLFGRWDVLPATGSQLVQRFDFDGELPSGSQFPVHRGVRWTASDDHHSLLVAGAVDAELGRCRVQVPDPVVTAARAGTRVCDPREVEGIVFAAAAHAACEAGRWDEVLETARGLGHRNAPVECAVHLGIDRWLGLSVGPVTRLGIGLRRMVG